MDIGSNINHKAEISFFKTVINVIVVGNKQLSILIRCLGANLLVIPKVFL